MKQWGITLHSGVNKGKRTERGVYTVIHKKYRNKIKNWEEVDEEIRMLKVRRNGGNLVIKGIYVCSKRGL